MAEENIERVEELVSKFIGRSRKIIDTKISRLTAPGENNCSLVLKVDVTTNNEEDGTREVLSTVAKVTPNIKFMRSTFEYSFKNEVAFYDIIVPTLQEFQREQGIDQVVDMFPKMYASRQNLNGDCSIVDDNAVLLMENLTASGYRNVDRMIGFDLATTKSILKDLAAFHAIPLAFKRIDPERFQKKIQPYLGRFELPPEVLAGNGGKRQNPDAALIEVLEEFNEFLPLLPLLKKNLRFKEFISEPNGLYSTIYHGDMWVNNIMTKFEGGKPVKNKFVDFQMYTHNSLAKDLFFFLWTSVQQPILEKRIDDLIKFYYENFIENLKQLKCDTTPFTLDTFLEEFTAVAKSEFGHTMGMICLVVFAKKGGNFSSDDSSQPQIFFINREDVTAEAKERALYMTKVCKERGWLLA